MKKILLTLFLLTAAMVNCQPSNVNVNVSWPIDSTATQYIIAIATSPDTSNWPIAEDMNWYDVDTTQLSRIYYLNPTATTVSFSSPINGEFIQAAGIIVGELGITSLLTVSNREKKPNVPSKMQFINLNINLGAKLTD